MKRIFFLLFVLFDLWIDFGFSYTCEFNALIPATAHMVHFWPPVGRFIYFGLGTLFFLPLKLPDFGAKATRLFFFFFCFLYFDFIFYVAGCSQPNSLTVMQII